LKLAEVALQKAFSHLYLETWLSVNHVTNGSPHAVS